MKYKTLFRLMIKAVGVIAFAEGLLYTVAQLGSLLWAYLGSPSAPPTGYVFSWLIGGVSELVFGLYLFFGGKWIADMAIPGNRPYCHECGYDLTGAAANRCPECDTPFQPDEVAPARGDADGLR